MLIECLGYGHMFHSYSLHVTFSAVLVLAEYLLLKSTLYVSGPMVFILNLLWIDAFVKYNKNEFRKMK